MNYICDPVLCSNLNLLCVTLIRRWSLEEGSFCFKVMEMSHDLWCAPNDKQQAFLYSNSSTDHVQLLEAILLHITSL